METSIDVEKMEPSYTVGVNVNWYNHYGEQYGGSLKKLKIVLLYDSASLVAQSVKNLPAMQETACNAGDLNLILGLGNPLEKELATHFSFLAWEIP